MDTRQRRESYNFSGPYVVIVAIILAATIFLVLIDSFRVYRGSVSILIVPKSEAMAAQSDEMLENLMDISHRLSFYDRLVADNPEWRDLFAGKSPDARKANWNKIFHISRSDHSTILVLSVDRATQSEALEASRKTAFALISEASHYYNIRTDIDLRIIEGPTASVVVVRWYWPLLVSLLLGYVLSVLINYIVVAVFEKMQPDSRFQLPAAAQLQNFSRPFGVRLEETDYPIRREQPARSRDLARPRKTGAAPENLPIADDYESSVPAIEAVAVKEEEPLSGALPIVTESISDPNREPSEEEYRRRLNALMRGEF
ncbi:hypothetical protein EPO05_04805 [Patescibacteria group bacterium]|nr:MAG: hypothetical protein EPO05_04805 [Patescibacteria group bacterium]